MRRHYDEWCDLCNGGIECNCTYYDERDDLCKVEDYALEVAAMTASRKTIGIMHAKKPDLDQEPKFRSLEVARLTGATLRQLQWWDERGIVSASNRNRNDYSAFDYAGHSRLYTAQQVGLIKWLVILRKTSFSFQMRRRIRLARRLDELGFRSDTVAAILSAIEESRNS